MQEEGEIKHWWRRSFRATLKIGWGGPAFSDIKVKEEDGDELKSKEKTRQSAF